MAFLSPVMIWKFAPTFTPVTDGIGDVLKIIHGEFLGDHVDDLVAAGI